LFFVANTFNAKDGAFYLKSSDCYLDSLTCAHFMLRLIGARDVSNFASRRLSSLLRSGDGEDEHWVSALFRNETDTSSHSSMILRGIGML